MKAATGIRFLYYLNKLFYLQYHLEYKKPVIKFPSNLNSFFMKVHSGLAASGKPHHGWWWGKGAGKGIRTSTCFRIPIFLL